MIIIWPFIYIDPQAEKQRPLPARPRPTKEQRAGKPMTAKQVAERTQLLELLARTSKGT